VESFEAGKVTIALATPLLNPGDLLHNERRKVAVRGETPCTASSRF
jgi:hypothetical protein